MLEKSSASLRAVDSNGLQAAAREQIDSIQLESLAKLVPYKRDTLSHRVAARLDNEFFRQPLKRKIQFVGSALRWCLQKARGRLIAARPPFVAFPVSLNDSTLRVAVHGTGSLGDFCTHIMFLQELYRAYGPMQIDFFCHAKKVNEAKFFFKRIPFIRNVVSANYLFALENSYDLVIYLRYLVKYRVINFTRVLEHNAELLNLIDQADAQFEPYSFLFHNHPLLDGLMARSFGWKHKNLPDIVGYVSKLNVSRNTFPVFIPDLTAATVLDRHDLANARYITVHDGFDTSYVPSGGSVTKCWPIDHWIKFVGILKEELPDLKVVQLGAVNSRKIAGVDIDLRNKTSLDEAMWLLKRAMLHVDGESGLVRLAHALHTRSVVLFGPTSKSFFAFDSNINLSSGECGDCWWSTADWLSRCPRGLAVPECMESIEPEEVARHVQEQFESLAPTRHVVDEVRLYGLDETRVLSAELLRDIFAKLNLPPVPISQHTENRDSGIYLHASKQWEYTQAYELIDAMAAELGRPLKIADVGGGRGALAPYLALMGHDVEVFDINYLWDHKGDLGVEARFQKWSATVGLKVSYGSLFNVPAESAAYDVVLLVSVVEHVPHKQLALQEALRLLKPNGKLFISFDVAVESERIEDGMRVEMCTPKRLRDLVATIGVDTIDCSNEHVRESVALIQKDNVAGIPDGMTVGSLVITKLPAP